METTLDCSIAIYEALDALTHAVNDATNRGIGRVNALIDAINHATTEAEHSSQESTNVAKESAELSRKLNGSLFGLSSLRVSLPLQLLFRH
jgi:hypothetical protein